MKGTLRDIYDAVDDFSKGMGRRRITTYSAACAYYLFMSLIPMIMLLVSIIQYTPLTQEMILEAISDYVPDSLYEIISSIISSIYRLHTSDHLVGCGEHEGAHAGHGQHVRRREA